MLRKAVLTPTQEQFRSLFDDAPCALVTADADGLIVLVNSRAERLFGYRRTELIGAPLDRLLPGAGAPAAGDGIAVNARGKDGSEFAAEISTSRTGAGEGRLLSVAVRPLLDHEMAVQALVHQATHDPLTGLANRSLFLDRLEHALARTTRAEARLAVLFLDLDQFKLVNDTHGHETGDLLLRALASRLSAALRPADTIARFGGDEFVVLCEDLGNEAAAVRIARRLAAACSRPVRLDGRVHRVTVSTGIAPRREGDEAGASELLRRADVAMYRAKAGAGGAIEVFELWPEDQGVTALADCAGPRRSPPSAPR